MIRELSIRNLAVVETVNVSFADGLHVLTGETGAGKSIMIDAISLALGARGSSDYVRHQAKKAEIAVLFEPDRAHPVWGKMEDLGLQVDGDGTILIKRDITQAGKSISRINGEIVTLAMVRQVGALLMDVHGQFDHQSLLREDEHIQWLDTYAGEPLATLKRRYRTVYDAYRKAEKEMLTLTENERDIAQRIDFLQFQAEEIAAAALEPGEDEQLQQKRTKLSHMEELVRAVQDAYHALQSDSRAMNDISQAMAHIETATQYDPALKEVLEWIQSAYYGLEEAASALGRMADEQEFDPNELNAVEARLHVIEQLKRKYAPTVNEIIQYGERALEELNILKNRSKHTEQLAKEYEALRSELQEKADQLTKLRKRAARQLKEEIERELKQLHMEETAFHVHFHPVEEGASRFHADGADRLKFLISTNPGEPPKPLAKIASGGELSRLMLALRSIFNEHDDVGALIFDEIDIGVSGRAAQAIAEKMSLIAQNKQVICVTHLPQVACMADRHFYIDKQVEAGGAITQVHVLSGKERVNEMARMLGGVEVTEKTKQHAAEMLRLAEERKQTGRTNRTGEKAL